MRILRRLLFACVAAALVPVLVATASVALAAKATGARNTSELLSNAQQHIKTIRNYYDAVGNGKIPDVQPADEAAPSDQPTRRTHQSAYRQRLDRLHAAASRRTPDHLHHPQ
jgi:hypothetical protein